MAGRAKFLRLFPFVTPEILISPGSRIDLDKILNFGMLPPVYLSEDPWEELKDYVSYYLREEILAESLTRNISAFSRFLLNAALSNAELLNYEQIGRDAQVSPRTVREHYVILEDTLIGKTLSPYKKAKSRKSISSSKFYFFDVGVVNALIGQRLVAKTAAWGHAFETFIFNELNAYLNYFRKDSTLNFYRTRTGLEVDFLIDGEIAVEVKATSHVTLQDGKYLLAMSEDIKLKRKILVSSDPLDRSEKGIDFLPIDIFLKKLWDHEIF